MGQSSTVLKVYFSVLTTQISGITYETNLMDQNGTSGYTVFFSNSSGGSGLDLYNSTTKATIQRALTTWREIVGMNWDEGGATATQALANDCLLYTSRCV